MKKKVLLSSMFIVTLLFGSAAGAWGATSLQKIEAYLNKDLKIKINNELFVIKDASGKVSYPISYNGTTYLPVRSVGEAVGLTVGFDSKGNSVLLDVPGAILEKPSNESEVVETVYFKNCTVAREAGAAPVKLGDPGYAEHLDRDGDGVGCE